MAPPSVLVLLSLVLSVQSRPRALHDDRLSMGTLPVLPSKRREPSHVQVSRVRAQDEAPDARSEDIFRRDFPADGGQPGTLTLPVIHAEPPRIGKRALEVQLENRSDVAYYAQRECLAR